MRGAPWILWVTDLSVKDPYYILPLVMALTTLFQTALNPLPPDPMQAKMMWIMPLVFSVIGLHLRRVAVRVGLLGQRGGVGSREGADGVGAPIALLRSEERRVGKECRSRWSPYH